MFFTADNRIVDEVVPALVDAGCTCVGLGVEGEFWSEFSAGRFDLVVADRRLLGPDPVVTVTQVRSVVEPPEVVILLATDEVVARAELLAAGALSVLSRETPSGELASALGALAERAAQQRQQRSLAVLEDSSGPNLSEMTSRNAQMSEFLRFVRRVAPSDSSLLILGETGVGKEYLAKAIHRASARGRGPFVPVNCAALSTSLLESELFGHVKGAFTGAAKYRRGYFELAHGGTLFLDEVGELNSALQVKLLRVLQERRVHPVGSEEAVKVDVRLIAATNSDLSREMEEKRFRADLFYRLSVISLRIPPLRARVEDIEIIAGELVGRNPTAARRGIEGISARALKAMGDYAWPGNIRELMNVIERAVLLAAGKDIDLADLPFISTGSRFRSSSLKTFSRERFATARARVVDEFEEAYLRGLLRQARGHLATAARLADMNPRSLYEKMRRHRLNKMEFRKPDSPESRDGR